MLLFFEQRTNRIPSTYQRSLGHNSLHESRSTPTKFDEVDTKSFYAKDVPSSSGSNTNTKSKAGENRLSKTLLLEKRYLAQKCILIEIVTLQLKNFR